jgi:hypothetical protein
MAVPDSLGENKTLYRADDVQAALNAPKPIKPLVDELVADLLVSTGRQPAAALHLAHTSGQPASVISLVEERLRRQPDQELAAARSPGIRGLALIHAWKRGPTPLAEPAPRTATVTGTSRAASGVMTVVGHAHDLVCLAGGCAPRQAKTGCTIGSDDAGLVGLPALESLRRSLHRCADGRGRGPSGGIDTFDES